MLAKDEARQPRLMSRPLLHFRAKREPRRRQPRRAKLVQGGSQSRLIRDAYSCRALGERRVGDFRTALRLATQPSAESAWLLGESDRRG
jgi:hypothetical protein